MKGKNLLIHGGWAVAALAAYGLGSLRPDPQAGAGAGEESVRNSSRSNAGNFTEPAAASGQPNRRERAPGRPSGGAITSLFGPLAASGGGLNALAEQAIRDPNPITRRLAFSRLLESMTAENAAEIREQLVALGANGDQWNDFHYSWGALAGKEAFAHAAASQEEDLAATLTGWAAARPAEAIALLDNLPGDLRGQRDRLAESVVAGLADTNRSLATDLVLRLAGEGNNRAGGLMEIVANETIRAEGPQAAAAWSESLPDGPLKGAAMNRVADSFVRRDPQAAALWVQPLAGQDYAAGAVARIGGEWAERDPVAAVGWLQTLPAGGGQSAGLRNAFGDWEDRDPVAASQYLMSMPRSPQRDSSISGFSSGYAWQDPAMAVAWANDIADPGLRQQTLTSVGRAYFRRDPDSARAWLESSNL
nr:hypothetical protein [Akkermansiaceae bacterium]